MKKLIINQKNLPRVGKKSDSSIRIRVNKPPNSHETVPLKKSDSLQLQQIQMCLQVLQRGNGEVLLGEEKINMMVQLLRCYKESLNVHSEMMTQSLRFSKIKFRSIADAQEKQNLNMAQSFTMPLKIDKNENSGYGVQMMNQRCVNNGQFQKDKRIIEVVKMDFNKNDINSRQGNPFNGVRDIKKQSQFQNNLLKLESQKQQSCFTHSMEQSSTQQSLSDTQKDQIFKLKNILKQKDQTIKQLYDRVQQLNINIQNLIKKNTLKSEQLNKLSLQFNQQKSTVHQLSTQITHMKQKILLLEQKVTQIQNNSKNKQNEWKRIEKQKNQKILQQIGRYETAQSFYQLTRKDLKQQNENLLLLLQERQQQIRNLYQVFNGFIEKQQKNLIEKEQKHLIDQKEQKKLTDQKRIEQKNLINKKEQRQLTDEKELNNWLIKFE